MPGLPEVTVAGTLTADPEMKWLDSGACVANFTVAANDRRFDQDQGQWVDAAATFLRCSLWRQHAENVVDSLSKGDRVLVTGALKQRSWETEHGEKRTVMELAVFEIGPSLKFATAAVHKNGRSNGAAASASNAAGFGPGNEPPF